MSAARITLPKLLQKAAVYIGLVLLCLIFLFPFFWMISASFKIPSELLGSGQNLIPNQFTLENYRIAFFTSVPLFRNFLNSVFVSLSYTLLALFLTSLAGYSFAVYDFPGRNILFALMLATMMIPGVVNLVPSFLIMKRLGWVNTYWALIIPGAAHAFGIFFLRQYISTLPKELFDAARIDGCNDFDIYRRIVLPIITPALFTLGIIDFIGSWNDYLWPLVMLRDLDMYTIVLAITTFPSARFRTPWGPIMAGSTVSVIPLIIVFLLFQKRLIAGITLGSIKGE